MFQFITKFLRGLTLRFGAEAQAPAIAASPRYRAARKIRTATRRRQGWSAR